MDHTFLMEIVNCVSLGEKEEEEGEEGGEGGREGSGGGGREDC